MSEQEKVLSMPEGIDFNQPILDINDQPILESFFEDEDRAEYLQELYRLTGRLERDEAEELLSLRKKRPIVLGNRVCQTLQAALKDEKIDGNQKLKRINLAREIQGSSDPDAPFQTVILSKGQKKMILDMAEKIWPSLVYARMHEAIEGNTKEE